VLDTEDEISAPPWYHFYPNPANDLITYGNEVQRAAIHNMQGLLMISSKNQTQLDVTGLANGTYFVTFYGKKVRYIQKMLKVN